MIRTELSLRLPNSPGALAGTCRLLSDARVNVLALSLESGGSVRVVVDNPTLAAGLLRERQLQVTERPVLVAHLSHSPGALAGALKLLADAGVNLEYVYGGGVDAVRTGVMVFGVDDAMRASAASLSITFTAGSPASRSAGHSRRP